MTYDGFLTLLKREMAPALGCTDPIGIAFCAASAAARAKGAIQKVTACYSMNLMKNVAAVTIPKTGGLCGARIATAVGICGGNPSKGLEVLEDLSPTQLAQAKALEKSGKLQVTIADNDIKLYMEVTITADENVVTAVVQDDYTNLTSLTVDGVELLSPSAGPAAEKDDSLYRQLSIASILDFASNVPVRELSHMEEAIEMNTALAKEGIENYADSKICKLLHSQMDSNNMADSAMLWTMAGVDARMSGCPLPAMSNTGSGNQGIVCTLPVYGAALALHSSHETMLRAAALSCLVAIYIKHRLGNLSTVCGCTIACTGAGCGIVYLQNGGEAEMVYVLKNMFGNVAGMICDGAKASCTLKAATCVHAACLASALALEGFGLSCDGGIVGKSEKDTIDYFVHTSNEGLSKMDPVILDIIMGKEENSL